MVQVSHSYVTTWKTIAWTIWIFVSKVMSLLLNMLSRFVLVFLPRSKWLLISWWQSLSTVILEAKKKKNCHCFHIFPFYLPWSDGTRCHNLSCLVVSNSATPWTVACQALLSMEFPRQKYWSGFPFPSPGDLHNPRIEPRSPALQADTIWATIQHQWF